MVNDIIDPLIGLFLPAGSLETMSVKVTNRFAAGEEGTRRKSRNKGQSSYSDEDLKEAFVSKTH